MAIPMIITTTNAAGHIHSVNIIESSTPSNAKIDPTERSMPPVMMTIPIPRLKIPYIPICRAMFCRLAAERNCGWSIATTTHNTTSKMKVPSSFFKASPWLL
jgi:hypothetical protein